MLTVNTTHFKPLMKDEWDGPCCGCNKHQARWMFIPSDGDGGALSICGLCWLYESNWGKNREADILEFKSAVEKELGKSFLSDKGKLVHCQDADRLLGAVGLVSQMQSLANRGNDARIGG